MMSNLVDAWEGFLHLYVRTGIRPPGGPISSAIWGEGDMRLLVGHLMLASPGGVLRLHQEVTGFDGLDPVDLIDTDPDAWRRDCPPPGEPFRPESPVDLVIETRVVNAPEGYAAVEEAASKLQAIVLRGLAKEAALCVLDKLLPPHRELYETLEDSRGITILRAFDEDLLRVPGAIPG